MFKEEILLALHSVHVLNSLLHLMSPVEFNISGYFSGVVALLYSVSMIG